MQSSFILDLLFFGIQHHLKASQAKVGQSVMWLIDQTATATLLKENGIYAQGHAISYHPLPSSSHLVTFRCGDHDNLAREIDKHEISNFANDCRRSRRKVFRYSTVQYGNGTLKMKMSVEIRFIPLTPPPLHIPLTSRCHGGRFSKKK